MKKNVCFSDQVEVHVVERVDEDLIPELFYQPDDHDTFEADLIQEDVLTKQDPGYKAKIALAVDRWAAIELDYRWSSSCCNPLTNPKSPVEDLRHQQESETPDELREETISNLFPRPKCPTRQISRKNNNPEEIHSIEVPVSVFSHSVPYRRASVEGPELNYLQQRLKEDSGRGGPIYNSFDCSLNQEERLGTDPPQCPRRRVSIEVPVSILPTSSSARRLYVQDDRGNFTKSEWDGIESERESFSSTETDQSDTMQKLIPSPKSSQQQPIVGDVGKTSMQLAIPATSCEERLVVEPRRTSFDLTDPFFFGDCMLPVDNIDNNSPSSNCVSQLKASSSPFFKEPVSDKGADIKTLPYPTGISSSNQREAGAGAYTKKLLCKLDRIEESLRSIRNARGVIKKQQE